jgi:hypothetical protein
MAFDFKPGDFEEIEKQYHGKGSEEPALFSGFEMRTRPDGTIETAIKWWKEFVDKKKAESKDAPLFETLVETAEKLISHYEKIKRNEEEERKYLADPEERDNPRLSEWASDMRQYMTASEVKRLIALQHKKADYARAAADYSRHGRSIGGKIPVLPTRWTEPLSKGKKEESMGNFEATLNEALNLFEDFVLTEAVLTDFVKDMERLHAGKTLTADDLVRFMQMKNIPPTPENYETIMTALGSGGRINLNQAKVKLNDSNWMATLKSRADAWARSRSQASLTPASVPE